MNVDKSFLKLAAQSLAESIDQRSMVHLARELIPEFNLAEKVSMPGSLDVPRFVIAKQIIDDMQEYNLLIPFLNIFFSIHYKGYKGRRYKISRFRELIVALYDMGFSLDSQTGKLYEDPQFRISRNWGVLREGIDYTFTFLWTDVMDSTGLVKNNSKSSTKKFYESYHSIVRKTVESRNGRIWLVEGDGILSAFHFGDHTEKALYSGISILNKIHDYNRFENVLSDAVGLRLVVNSGSCTYFEHNSAIKETDAVKKTIQYEKATLPGTITVDSLIAGTIGGVLEQVLHPVKTDNALDYSSYAFSWDK